MKLLPRYIALISFSILMALFIGYSIYNYRKPHFPTPIPIYTKNLPMQGNSEAPIHIVIFQDISYQNSIEFNQTVYPLIKRHYIDTGLVKYSVALVSFTQSSKLSSSILYCALSQSEKAFFSLLNLYYADPFNLNLPSANLKEKWIELARQDGAFLDIGPFQSCLSSALSSSNISANTTYAKDLMGAYFQVPAVYVSGMKVLDPSVVEIERFILQALKVQKKKTKQSL